MCLLAPCRAAPVASAALRGEAADETPGPCLSPIWWPVSIHQIALIPVRMSHDSIGSSNAVLVYWILNGLQLLRMVRLVALFYTIQKILLHVTVSHSEGDSSQGRQSISNLKIYILLIAYLLFFLINAVACFW